MLNKENVSRLRERKILPHYFFVLLTILNTRKKGIKIRLKSFIFKKSKKNAQFCEKLLIPHLGTNNEFSIVFNHLQNSSGKRKIGAS